MFLPSVSFGQFQKGTKYIGGAVSYTSIQDRLGSIAPPSTQFRLDGQVGIFLNESLAIGPVIDVYANTYNTINPVTNLYEPRKYNGYSGGIFARKFFNLTDTFFFSLEGKSIIGNVSRPETYFEEEHTSLSLLFAFRPVFTFLPNNRWAFDASFGEISYSANWHHPGVDNNYFTANLGQVRMGVNYFFNKRNGKQQVD